VTDTIAFRTNNVTPRTMAVTQDLMLHGASLYEVIDRTLGSKPLSHLELWKLSFPSIEFDRGLVWATVTLESLNKVGLDDMTDGGLVSLLVSIEEARISAVFKEQPDNKVEISFRSKNGYDVGSVAFGLGGGGHRQASGVTVSGSLAEVQQRVLPLLRVLITAPSTP
jgi:bifunctional oligoribonuclease and PAP phosphatase NrnA